MHSKLYVFDDKYAIIGSANGSRRSFNCDSEAAVGLLDNFDSQLEVLTLAHRLRIRLWAQHLGMDNDQGYTSLVDAVAASVHWKRPPAGHHLAEYVKVSGSPCADWEWDLVREPFADPL